MKTLSNHFKVVAITAGVFSFVLGAGAQEPGAEVRKTYDLQGRITDISGKPLKDAHVFIYTAMPKEGPAYLCPSCYLDCGKRAATDERGELVIKSLASTLRFRLLVACEGYLPKFIPNVDPADGPVTVAMERFDLSQWPLGRVLKGRIVDDGGEPIIGAAVSVEGWSSDEGRTTWGPSSKVMRTPLAVSDLQGEFSLAAAQDLLSVDLEIHCRNYAQAEYYEIPFGAPSRDLHLAEGGAVTGRLIHQGKPLSKRIVSISSEDRGMRSNFTKESIATDPQGRFTFYNLPAGLVYHAAASMDAIGELGITPLRAVKELHNGEFHDLGDLVVQAGLTVSGKVELSDGKPIPQNSVIFLNHDKIWGGQSRTLPADGTFKFEGMHPGEIGCTVRMPGYRLAKRNRSYHDLNGGELLATLSESATNLVLLLEPGDRGWNGIGSPPGMPRTEAARSRPLGGIEPLPDNRLAGMVYVLAMDAETGEPLESYQVTPGWRFDRSPNTVWQAFQTQTVTSPETPVEVEQRSGPAFLQVAAEGYLPESIGVQGKIDQRMTVELQPGHGLRGVVLRPDGEPATGAQVVMLRPSVDRNISSYGFVSLSDGRFGRQTARNHHVLDADQEGRFEFPPTQEVGPLFFAHDTGFEKIEKPEAGQSLTIRLRAWAAVSGGVLNFEKNDDLYVRLSAQRPRIPGEPVGRSATGFLSRLVGKTKRNLGQPEQPPLMPRIGSSITPDASGNFRIDQVPPGHWWLVLSKKEVLPDQKHRGLFTFKPLDTVKINAESDSVTETALAAPTPEAGQQ